MEEALSFFRAFEVWIYLILGLGGLFYIRKFILAWEELREAGFGLERENAQGRLNQSASVLVVLLMIAIAEFVLVSFVAPTVPGANSLPTPTLSLFATPSLTLPPQAVQTGQTRVSATPNPTELAQSICVANQIEIISPKGGAQVSGVVEIIGTSAIPNFGFYKFQIRRSGEAGWVILQAGNEVKQNAKLGDWDTRRLSPGEYELGLFVVDNQGRISLPCVVKLIVNPTADTTPNP